MKHSATIWFAGLALTGLGALPAPAQQNGQNPNTALGSYIASLPVEAISPAEQADLLHMFEEEKLARDVYRVLSQTWSVPAFANIAQSEQSHMDLVELMLQRYGIPKPIQSDRVGAFANPAFAGAFTLLTDYGSISQLHAEIVGCLIEELDILDLDFALARSDNRDLDTVWQNLQRGSRNHLRSFAGLIEARGITYPGILMTYPRVVAILTTPRETAAVDENGLPLN